jgi:hypothetical protein
MAKGLPSSTILLRTYQDPLSRFRNNAEVMRDHQNCGFKIILQLDHEIRIWACIVTSRAVVGSSAMRISGLHERSHGDHDLCLIPPES